ncbi:YhgE/Pip domain-containing protein [Novisyntrophococcus fermenticellae]|uniref:YhgE/Pip domain-containing protein n=1 Tax=Novisyntrophococcus fermenticellae TaxID=2068655 RepID=UPI001E394913|nr:YhgE/Pip domain-containing protein [Novisyntrophococcus fermenticellae]
MIKNEWQNLLHNKMLLIVLIAIVAIPTIYTTLFLGSMWDPYGQLEQLPVAVVNEDKEVVYYNEKLDVGSRLVLNLKENDSLKFDFVNSSIARKRLEDGKYYMVITIPENFSKNASTLLDDKPQKMVLLYDTNPGRNYIATKMSESALSKIKDSVATEVTKTYAQVMFEQIGTVGAGMNEAAAGSGTLKSGLEQLSDGNTKISANLQLLSDSTLTFKGGSDELKQGLEKYIQGVEQANKGAKQLNAGVSQLKAGTDEVQAKLPELSKGAGQLAEGTKGLSDGTSRLVNGGRELKDGAVHVDDNMRTLNAGLSQLRDQTSMLPESAEQLDTGAQSLKTGAAKLQTGMNGLNQGMKSLQNGALELNGGLTQLAGPGAEQLYNGLDKVKAELSNQLISTADSISAGDAGEDVGYLSDMLDTAVASGDTAQIAEIARKAIGLAESNQDAARTANSNVQTLPDNANIENAVETALDNYKEQALQQYVAKVEEAQAGSAALLGGMNSMAENSQSLASGTDELNSGIKNLADGTSQLKTSAPLMTAGIASAQSGARQLQRQGTSVLKAGTENLYQGVDQLDTASHALEQGTEALMGKLPQLSGGVFQLADGVNQLKNGTTSLNSGTQELISNSKSLLSGSSQLSIGASRIWDATSELTNASATLGDGLDDVLKGSDALKTSLEDGAGEVNEISADNNTLNQFADPVEAKETQITDVRNNGHAMAAYMMSVGLWVACIAFCIMYPLTEYSGELKSGFRWWLSKAAVIYPIAVLMASAMVGMLYLINGFRPVEWGKTILVACIASMTFMSIMYFFNVLFGKVGSFIMLIFMVVQLAGSAGTYPIELSGSFVAKIHKWLPFSYTVDAFRATIAGGSKIGNAVFALAVLTAVFTAMTVWIFQIRASRLKRGKQSLYDYIEKAGLA